jgi:RNA polymerase sigma factor (sigma-70 family)
MPARRTDSMLRQMRTLFSLGRVGDRADGELLECFENHHAVAEAAFEELVVRHGAMVLDVCRGVLREPHDVEDAFQATFVVLVRRAGSIRNRDALGGWLHRVALRVALQAKSEAAHRREIEQQAVASETSERALNDVEQAEIRAALHEELDRIPASYRTAIIACYLEGLTHEEAACRLNWPVGTVRSRLARGRDRLRDRLTRRGLAPSMILPALASRPELVPSGFQTLAVRAMFSYLAGRSLAGKASGSVAALSEKVVRAMNARIMKIAATVVITIGLVGGALPFLTMVLLRQAHANAAQKPAPPGWLAGIVRDFDGHPVAGATVVAGAFTTKANHQIATTGPDGRFAFQTKEGEPKLAYVLAYKEGLAPASKFHGLGEKPTPTGGMELVLITAAPFVGIVHDRDGAPIGGAKVGVKYMRGKGGRNDHNPILENVIQGTPLESLFETITDKQGGFRFPAVPAPQRVVIHVKADGKADLSSEVPGDYEAGYISGSEAKPARLAMEPEARIVGRVVTKLPGVFVSGVKIGLQSTHDSTQFWRDAKTDAEGRFEMRGLPEGGGNLFPMDHPSDGPWTYRAIDNQALHPGKTAEVTIELIAGVLVEGQVVDAATGDPVAGVFIGMYGPARPRTGAAIMGSTTDEKGKYRFHLPPGKTQLYVAGGPWTYAGQEVEIPAGKDTFTAPTLEVKKKEAPPKPVAKPPATAPATAPDKQNVSISGVVQDVSDQPIGGATVVGAILHKDMMADRRIVTTGPDGRFTLELAGSKEANARGCVYAFKEGLAPAGASMSSSVPNSAGKVTLILPRPRPFVGIVQDKDEKPIAGADVRVQSIKAPIPDGAGMTVTEFSWPVVEGTPLESAVRTFTDERGMIRLPSMPARSQINMVVSAKGMRTHRTTDFTLPAMTGRWPAGFDAGFLHGDSDAPATLYLDPEEKPRRQK